MEITKYSTEIISLLIVFVMIAAIDAHPRVNIFRGAVVALIGLASAVSLGILILGGVAGATAGRIIIAVNARSGRDPFSDNSHVLNYRAALRQKLESSKQYKRLTFAAGMTPFLPSNALFSLLGVMRAPLAPAALGSFIGGIVPLAISAWIFFKVSVALAGGEAEAVSTLGIFCAVMLVIGYFTKVSVMPPPPPNSNPRAGYETHAMIDQDGEIHVEEPIEAEPVRDSDDDDEEEILEGEVIPPQTRE